MRIKGFNMIKFVKGYEFIISPEDEEMFEMFSWRVVRGRNNSGPYLIADATIDNKRTLIRFHRMVCGNPKNLHVDHKDRNPLNCTRENLRAVTPSVNMRNRNSWKKEESESEL